MAASSSHHDAWREDELPVLVQMEVVIMPKRRRKQLTRTKVWEVTCIAKGPLATPTTKEKERIDGGMQLISVEDLDWKKQFGAVVGSETTRTLNIPPRIEVEKERAGT